MEVKGLNYQYFCVHVHEHVATHITETQSHQMVWVLWVVT